MTVPPDLPSAAEVRKPSAPALLQRPSATSPAASSAVAPVAPLVVTMGESMALVRSVEPGGFVHAPLASVGFGGSETNVAIGLCRLGIRARWLGRLGCDSFGDLIARELAAEGVEVLAERDPGHPTGLMVKERRTASFTRVSYYRAQSAASRMAPDALTPAALEGASLVHITGITAAISDTARQAVFALVRAARARQITVSFDLNYRSALWAPAEAAPVLRELVTLADIVFAGPEEAQIVLPGVTGAAELAAGLAALGPGECVIKDGARGAFVRTPSRTLELAALPITALDSVGAGDAFVAGYLAELLCGRNLDERLATAVAAGAFACLSPGDWEGAPSRAELGLFELRDPVTR